jgi:hypothetical protein
VRLLFRKACACSSSPQDLPKPFIRTIEPPDMNLPIPELTIEVGFTCSACGKSWAAFGVTREKQEIPSL